MSEEILVYDIEADGLLEDSTSVHCIVAKALGSDTIYKYWDNPLVLHTQSDNYLTREELLDLFHSYDKIICHNQIMYDMPMLLKFYNIDLNEIVGHENIIDTFVWSQVLNPDRLMPRYCPTTIIPSKELAAKGFKPKKIGPHGLDSWGYRVGRKKPAIHDWTTFTPQILGRCVEDVLINEGAYKMLLEEAGL